jgi:N-acetylmuramoyl-L-alanine amidase
MNLTERLLTVNPFSRPGTKRQQIQALIFHWTGKPMQPAIDVRNWFESLKDQKPPEDPELAKNWKPHYSSAHYDIDQDGSIIRCIPESEIAFHVGSDQIDPASGKIYTDWARAKFGEHATHPDIMSPNACTLGIEMCPLDAEGNFASATLNAAVELARDICSRLGLNPLADIATHNMVVGWKDCPRLWVNHPENLTEFRAAVAHSASAVENERTGT